MSSHLNASIKLCRLMGLFPPESGSRLVSMAYKTYQAVLFVIIVVVSTSMTIQLFVAPDMKMMARTIDMWTMCWTGLYKWFYLAAFQHKFRAFHRLLDSVHVPATVVCGQGARLFTSNHLHRMKMISNLYALSGCCVTAFLSLGAMITYPKGNQSELEYFNDPKSYPLCCWMPFIVPNYWAFTALCILKALVLLFAVSTYLIIDTYMFGAIYILGGEFEMLKLMLSSINHIIDDAPKSDKLILFNHQRQIKCYSLLSECIKHHSLVLQCLNKLRIMFSTLIIFDYLHAITSLTFAMFQTTISIGLGETISLFSFILISLYHQFLNNFFGEYIIQKQLSVQTAAYDFPWLRVNKKSRQLLAMMICEANKPLVISGFYMYKLCYKSFIAFLKALYTYYMVLRKVNLED